MQQANRIAGLDGMQERSEKSSDSEKEALEIGQEDMSSVLSQDSHSYL